jgi:hypothetical protein
MSTTKGCYNCMHRYGWVKEYWKCSRTGFYVSTEMKYGGRCAEGERGTELRLWAPRQSLLGRIFKITHQASTQASPTASTSGMGGG